MFRFIVLASVLALSAQGQYNNDPRNAAIISEQRYLSGDGTFGAAYTQEDGTNFKEETDSDGTRHGSYSYVDPNGKTRTISYTAGKNGFQATGDDLPVPPPAPAHAQLAVAQAAQYTPRSYDQGNSADFDDGQYDPRYNDPNFAGSGRSSAPIHVPQHVQNPVQPSYVQHAAQRQYTPQPQPQPQPQQQHYNNVNNVDYVSQYDPSTTPHPHRYSPPEKIEIQY